MFRPITDKEGKFSFPLLNPWNAIKVTYDGKHGGSGKRYTRCLMLRPVRFILWESSDLGLSVRWDTKKIYAAAPDEDYGSYYAWGETLSKEDYSSRWTTYKYSEGSALFICK